MIDIVEWHYRRLKGRIAAHVARGRDRPQAIIKSAQTMLAKGDIGPEGIARILEEVQTESVQPFLGPPWNKPERLTDALPILIR